LKVLLSLIKLAGRLKGLQGFGFTIAALQP
jgi:hypothetical protein